MSPAENKDGKPGGKDAAGGAATAGAPGGNLKLKDPN